MSHSTGPWDASLIDLFRSEVETHSESLSAALLALERVPGDTSRIDEMMRAAHSIKGASRVVGGEPAVHVAHVMEDCYVAAQKAFKAKNGRKSRLSVLRAISQLSWGDPIFPRFPSHPTRKTPWSHRKNHRLSRAW